MGKYAGNKKQRRSKTTVKKEMYENLELNIVKFETEDVILMSGLDNDGGVGDWGDEDLG